MDISIENFPLYKLLVDLDQPGVERMKEDYAKAKVGGDEEQYQFALGIQTVAALYDSDSVPGMTPEIKEKTLQSCLAVFNEAASHGHQNAKFMVEDFKQRGLGQPTPPAKKSFRGRFRL